MKKSNKYILFLCYTEDHDLVTDEKQETVMGTHKGTNESAEATYNPAPKNR